MKRLSLKVSKDFTIPTLLETDDVNTNEEVVRLGVELYLCKREISLKEISNDEIKKILTERDNTENEFKQEKVRLEKRFEEEREKNQLTLNLLRVENENLKMQVQNSFNIGRECGIKDTEQVNNNLKETLDESKKRIRTLEEQLVENFNLGRDCGIKNLEEVNNNLKENLEDCKKRTILLEEQRNDESKLMLREIKSEVKCLVDKLSGSSDKGLIGETIIESYIQDKFSTAKLLNTSKETAQGDMRFELGNLRTMIESKNVQILEKREIDKFWRDIENLKKKNEINSALLISGRDTNLIEGQKGFYFHYKYDIPIIYISNVYNNIDMIKMSILMLNYLVEHNDIQKLKTCNNDDKTSALISCIHKAYLKFQEDNASIQAEMKAVKVLEEKIKEREKNNFNMDKIICDLMNEFPETRINNNLYLTNKLYQNDKVILDELVRKIKELGSPVTTKIITDWGYNINMLKSQIYNKKMNGITGLQKLNEYALGK